MLNNERKCVIHKIKTFMHLCSYGNEYQALKLRFCFQFSALLQPLLPAVSNKNSLENYNLF